MMNLCTFHKLISAFIIYMLKNNVHVFAKSYNKDLGYIKQIAKVRRLYLERKRNLKIN